VLRRTFLKTAIASIATPAVSWPQASGWRRFDVVTRVEIQGATGLTRVWLPLPVGETSYQRVEKQSWKGNAASHRVLRATTLDGDLLVAEWPAAEPRPELELTFRITTRDRVVDATAAGHVPSSGSMRRYLQPTRLLPLDGIVRETAERITRGRRDDESRARAIYDWVVENTVRDPVVRGCGLGDIRGMLETGDLRGKCADLNALFVGLSRAVGVPARDVYGLRVAPSRSFASLGRSGDVTTAQHCRAEFHSARRGWVPADPADVRKVILEEAPGLDLTSPAVQQARRELFGSWEGNWIAFNDAHDVRLPHSSGPVLPFFMYPQAETGGRRLDSLDPGGFRYRITASELT
jgi:transglutaminase-like putative cysteine protease